ncbi:MAG TPA: hypothetical protein VJ854_01435 [Sphaerochaeta sp.]|nr:hypothetical protein [Sphaerochaeta sp.]
MNNLDWYTKVTLFCKAYQSCTECPFFLLQGKEETLSLEGKKCFTSKEALEQLSDWLSQPIHYEQELQSCSAMPDNQWLKDLLKGEFGEDDEDIDAFYMEDDFI